MIHNPPPYKVIFDTDPGVDDPLPCTSHCFLPQIDLVGIATTFGTLCRSSKPRPMRSTLPAGWASHSVTQGVRTPWCKPAETPPDFIHGADGLATCPTVNRALQVVDPRSSAQFIVDMARTHPGAITLVAVGATG